MKFSDLGLSEATLKAVLSLGYETPTPIQEKSIPIALTGRDVVARAQTGTGKTLAFGIPMVEKLKGGRPGLRALALAPTRELAIQVYEYLAPLGKAHGLKCAVVYGGDPILPQMRRVRETIDILVATPGRLVDLLQRHVLHLYEIQYFVLDEGDRMLEMGFWEQLSLIVRSLPEERQTMLFSATMPKRMRDLEKLSLHDHEVIEVSPPLAVASRITQDFTILSEAEKKPKLVQILQKEKGQTLVFTRTKARANQVADELFRKGFSVARIHGDREQNERRKALEGFTSGRYRVLVATDVASRGLDVDDITHVVNYDFPHAVEDHVHRIGRTARAGAAGHATTFVLPQEEDMLAELRAQLDGKKEQTGRRLSKPAKRTSGGSSGGGGRGGRRPSTGGGSGRPGTSARSRDGARSTGGSSRGAASAESAGGSGRTRSGAGSTGGSSSGGSGGGVKKSTAGGAKRAYRGNRPSSRPKSGGGSGDGD